MTEVDDYQPPTICRLTDNFEQRISGAVPKKRHSQIILTGERLPRSLISETQGRCLFSPSDHPFRVLGFSGASRLCGELAVRQRAPAGGGDGHTLAASSPPLVGQGSYETVHSGIYQLP
jgi:hypothetical protein